jgi:hypothetical protein
MPSPSQDNEISVYLQRPSLLLLRTNLINYFSDSPHYAYPARFNAVKPPDLQLSDDAWAALKLRVDPLARDILDPHRHYLVAVGMACFISVVFYAVRPGYDTKRIQSRIGDDYMTTPDIDDEILYDDYFHDDEYERRHALDDVVLAEYEYLNTAIEKKIWTWRITLALTLFVLFGSAFFLAVLMERRNAMIDDSISSVIEEIRPRIEGEGLTVEYRTRSRDGSVCGKYIRPIRVVVFRYLEETVVVRARSELEEKSRRNFFSEDYQREHFANSSRTRRSKDGAVGLEGEITSNFSLL